MKTLLMVAGMILSVSVMASSIVNGRTNDFSQSTSFACTTDKYGTTICW